MKEFSRTNSICPSPDELLLSCVKKNETESIKTLITSNPNLLTFVYPFTGKNILEEACSEEGVLPQTVETLIELGANPAGKPLHLAAKNLDSGILKIIVDNIKQHINDTDIGNTALLTLIKSEAIKQNEKDLCKNVEILIRAGIDVNKADSKNLTAIFWAANKGYKDVVKTILDTSVCHVDLDSHKLRNKSARELIKEKQLYFKPLPEPILYQDPSERIFTLVKSSKQDEFVQYFDSLNDFNKLLEKDDGTSTLLQYSCERNLPQVVQYLLAKGSKIDTVGSNPKTPIEIALEHGFYEIVEILVKSPDWKISSETLCNLIKHYDNSKFEKIDHERCCHIVLDTLGSLKLNIINEIDTGVNTAIHYSLRYADDGTTRKLLNLGASLACKNEFGVMPIQDIRPDLLKQHLDDCVQFKINNKNDEKRDFEVEFNYKSLIPPRHQNIEDMENPKNLSTLQPETEVINYMSRSPELKQLLAHPVVVAFLLMKWHRIRLLFYTNLLFSIIFVASLVTYIFTRYANFDPDASLDVYATISWFTLNLTFWILVLRELFQIVVSPITYFKTFENYIELALIIITGMMLYINSPTDDTRRQVASVAILLGAFELVLMLGHHPKFSTNVVMLKTVSLTFFKLLLWYSLLIIAFAMSFYILFAKTEAPTPQTNETAKDEDEDLFKGPGASLFKTIVMLTGEFDAGSMNFQTYPITSKLIFSLFVFVITIILLNLLNGLAVSDTQAIKNEAELVGHTARAQHIFYVESMVLGNVLPTSLMRLIQKMFCCFPCDQNRTYNFFKPVARRICIFTANTYKFVVFPNQHGRISTEFHFKKRGPKSIVPCYGNCSDAFLDTSTLRELKYIIKDKKKDKKYHTQRHEPY